MNLITFTSRAAAALVAAVAGFSSYRHIFDVAIGAGEHHAVAVALPLSIDGLIVVGTMALLEDKRAGRLPRQSARYALGFGVLATLAANIASAEPTWTARAVAAVPAVSFLIAVEVLARTGKVRVPNSAVPAEESQVEPFGKVPAVPNCAPARGKPRAVAYETEDRTGKAPGLRQSATGTAPLSQMRREIKPASPMIEPANAEITAPGKITSQKDRLSEMASDLDPRESAREVYRASVAEGVPMSGAELARRFGKSARWGVERVAEVRRNGTRDLAEVKS